MKINYIIAPRQVGKTQAALYEFVKDPGNTYFFTHSHGHQDIIRKQLSKFYFLQNPDHPPKIYSRETYNIFSVDQLHRLHSIRTNKAIFDEYNLISAKKKREIRNEIHRFKEIYIFTTMSKMYNKEIFDIVKQAKREGINCCVTITKRVTDNYRISAKVAAEEVEDLYYDLITDPETNIIYDPFTPFFGREQMSRRIDTEKRIKESFSEKEYKVYYENNFLTEGELEEKKLHIISFLTYY